MDISSQEENPHHELAKFGEWLLVSEIAVLILSALFAVLFTRGDASMDAISYFEMADGIHYHHWSSMVNGYWTPAYAVFLSATRGVTSSKIGHEWPVARAMNLLLLVLFAGSALYFTRTLRPIPAKNSLLLESKEAYSRLSRLGLSVFAIAMILELINSAYDVTRINPDVLVGALFILVTAVLSKMQARMGVGHFIALGFLCGVGYLAKAIFFPLTLLAVFMACFIGPKRGKAIGGAMLAILIFSAIAGPYIAVLSRSKGHFSYGESGHLNYIWLVNGFPRPPLLPSSQGHVDVEKLGLKHPVTVLGTDPFIASFGGQIEGTYSLWTDASYWLDGVKVPFSPRAALARFLVNVKNMFEIIGDFTLSTAIVIVLALAGRGKTRWRKVLVYRWPALLLSTAMIGLYMMVEVDTRYIATAILVLDIVVLASIRFHANATMRPGIPTLFLAVFVALVLHQTASALPVLVSAAKEHSVLSAFTSEPQWMAPERQRAEAFRKLNLPSPEGIVACIGSNDCDNYWMRLAGLHVNSQAYYMPGEIHLYWHLSPERQHEILQQLAQTGARIAISTSDLNAPVPAGWFRLGESDTVVIPLPAE